MTTADPQPDTHASATLTRQPAYDATYALIRRLGNHLPADTAHRNAPIWRAVEGALDAMGVPTTARWNGQPIHEPLRGSDIETWIKRTRDHFPYGDSAWITLDNLLDDYRDHADTGTPLDSEIQGPTGGYTTDPAA